MAPLMGPQVLGDRNYGFCFLDASPHPPQVPCLVLAQGLREAAASTRCTAFLISAQTKKVPVESQDLSLHAQMATQPPGIPSHPWGSLQGSQEAFAFPTHPVPQVPRQPCPSLSRVAVEPRVLSLDSLPPASLPRTLPTVR